MVRRLKGESPAGFLLDDFLKSSLGACMEQREAVRYPMRAVVLFKWTDADGVGLQDGGFTRDISTAGLFVYCDRPPPVKTAFSMEVLLPLFEAPHPGLRLMGQGVVVRVEEQKKQTGFAAKVYLDSGDIDPN